LHSLQLGYTLSRLADSWLLYNLLSRH